MVVIVVQTNPVDGVSGSTITTSLPRRHNSNNGVHKGLPAPNVMVIPIVELDKSCTAQEGTVQQDQAAVADWRLFRCGAVEQFY
jgi:hypothetical protein